MRTSAKLPHRGNRQRKEHQHEIHVHVAEHRLEREMPVVIAAIVARTEAGPLVRLARHGEGLLRPLPRDGKGLSGEQPSGNRLPAAALQQQRELRSAHADLAAQPQADSGLAEVEGIRTGGEGVFARDLAVMIGERAAHVQAAEHVQVARSRRGVVVVDPPRAARGDRAATPAERLEPEMIAGEAPPAAGSAIKSFLVDAGHGVRVRQGVTSRLGTQTGMRGQLG